MTSSPELNNKLKSIRLINAAIREMLAKRESLPKAEARILAALRFDPNNIEALQEAAHFYYAVDESPRKAKRYASKCQKLAMKISKEMDAIVRWK